MKKKIIFNLFVILFVAGGYACWQVFGPTVRSLQNKYFYIKTGATFIDIKQSLVDQKIIINPFFFNLVSKHLNYSDKVKAGRYLIKNGTSVFSLLRMLRSGNQSPVNLVINKLRIKEDLAQKIAENFECDSASVMAVLHDKITLQKYGVNKNTIMCIVIPNSYQILWNSSAEKIISKLYDEKERFWNAKRIGSSKALNLTKNQVYIMASIVEEETNKQEDKGNIASVYINRMATGMKLQADPTVKFALQDFRLTRIMHKHLVYESAFNTYQNLGLPPGPICTPSIKSIDAVLDAPKTNYIYFVAKPDFNGYSNFSSSYSEHLIFAKAYQQALDNLIKNKRNKKLRE